MWTKLTTWLLPKKKLNNTTTNLNIDAADINFDLLNQAIDNMYSNMSINVSSAASSSSNSILTGGYGTGSATGVSLTGVNTWNIPTNTWSAGTITLGTNSYNEYDADLTLKRNGRPDIKVGATLDLICEHLNIIIPEKSLLDNNPALKMAYDHYKETLQKTFSNPELKSAVDSYKTLEKLVRDDEEE